MGVVFLYKEENALKVGGCGLAKDGWVWLFGRLDVHGVGPMVGVGVRVGGWWRCCGVRDDRGGGEGGCDGLCCVVILFFCCEVLVVLIVVVAVEVGLLGGISVVGFGLGWAVGCWHVGVLVGWFGFVGRGLVVGAIVPQELLGLGKGGERFKVVVRVALYLFPAGFP
jgi:hypothetical protein